MGRRNKGALDLILDILVTSPWWVSVIFSACVYVILKWILPTLHIENIILKNFVLPLNKMAAFVAVIFLIPAPISAFNAWRKRELLEKQKGIDSIRTLSWKEFEELIAEAFRRKGYSVIENMKAGPDEGIDITLRKKSELFLVQCKHWKTQKVGVTVVREMYGVMVSKHATGVIIVTSGFFTQEAQSFAKGKPIELIEGNQLTSFIKEVQSSNITSIQTAKEPKIDLPNICPKCNNQLVVRSAHKHTGDKFWGCSSFPKCRFTKSY